MSRHAAEPEWSDPDWSDPGQPAASRLPATLSADGVRYQRAGRLILDDVSVSAYPYEVLAITGPSGSGKSSLLALLAGLERTRRWQHPAQHAEPGRGGTGWLRPGAAGLRAGQRADRRRERRDRAAGPAGRPARRAGPGRGPAGRGRAGRGCRSPGGAAVRGPAAAGGDRPGAGDQPCGAAGRRTHRRAGPCLSRTGAGSGFCLGRKRFYRRASAPTTRTWRPVATSRSS